MVLQRKNLLFQKAGEWMTEKYKKKYPGLCSITITNDELSLNQECLYPIVMKIYILKGSYIHIYEIDYFINLYFGIKTEKIRKIEVVETFTL